jgi:hypothetical protein
MRVPEKVGDNQRDTCFLLVIGQMYSAGGALRKGANRKKNKIF